MHVVLYKLCFVFLKTDTLQYLTLQNHGTVHYSSSSVRKPHSDQGTGTWGIHFEVRKLHTFISFVVIPHFYPSAFYITPLDMSFQPQVLWDRLPSVRGFTLVESLAREIGKVESSIYMYTMHTHNNGLNQIITFQETILMC